MAYWISGKGWLVFYLCVTLFMNTKNKNTVELEWVWGHHHRIKR